MAIGAKSPLILQREIDKLHNIINNLELRNLKSASETEYSKLLNRSNVRKLPMARNFLQITEKLQKDVTRSNAMLHVEDHFRDMENHISNILDVIFSQEIGITADALASTYVFPNAQPVPKESLIIVAAFKDEDCYPDDLDDWIEMDDVDEDEGLASLLEEHRLYSSRSDQL